MRGVRPSLKKIRMDSHQDQSHVPFPAASMGGGGTSGKGRTGKIQVTVPEFLRIDSQELIRLGQKLIDLRQECDLKIRSGLSEKNLQAFEGLVEKIKILQVNITSLQGQQENLPERFQGPGAWGEETICKLGINQALPMLDLYTETLEGIAEVQRDYHALAKTALENALTQGLNDKLIEIRHQLLRAQGGDPIRTRKSSRLSIWQLSQYEREIAKLIGALGELRQRRFPQGKAPMPDTEYQASLRKLENDWVTLQEKYVKDS